MQATSPSDDVIKWDWFIRRKVLSSRVPLNLNADYFENGKNEENVANAKKRKPVVKKKIPEKSPKPSLAEVKSPEDSINVRWFKEQISRVGLSQRTIATLLGINQSIISHMFSGRRRMTLVEADQWADILNVPLTDVLLNAGVPIPESVLATIAARNVENPEGTASAFLGPVRGWIDGNYRIHWETPPSGSKTSAKGQGASEPGGLICVRYKTSGTPLDGLDGGLVYFRAVPAKTFDYEAIGRLSAVRVNGVRSEEHTLNSSHQI